MAKKESTLISMVITLFVITVISAAALGMVFEATKGPIAAAKLAKKTNAISQVVPDFDNDPLHDSWSAFVDGDSLIFYIAKNGLDTVGIAVETFSSKGFGGSIKLMVGLLPNGIINKIEVLEHKETPGLGDKMESAKSDFSKQFENKNPSLFKIKVKKDQGDVDAITASTISSRAFCDAVNKACQTYLKEVEK